LTNTALSGARLYWETFGKIGFFSVKGVSIPVAVSVFPDELYPVPRSWAERAYAKLVAHPTMPEGLIHLFGNVPPIPAHAVKREIGWTAAAKDEMIAHLQSV